MDVLSNLIITKVYSATTMYNEKTSKTKRINRPSWALVIKYEGETIYTSNGNTYLSNAENIIILPKGCSYEWCCTKPGHFSIIEVQSDIECDRIFSINVPNSDKILKAFKELEYKRALKKPMYEIESIKDVYSIILRLFDAAPKKYTPSIKQNKVIKAREYIAQNFNREIKNSDLAEITGLSLVYFRKLFTEVYGISPIAYAHRLRINKAKEMLRSDYGSITDIAQSLGYNNIYDFSRDFKKHTGVAPTKYS